MENIPSYLEGEIMFCFMVTVSLIKSSSKVSKKEASSQEEEAEDPDPDGLELLNDPEVRGVPTGVP